MRALVLLSLLAALALPAPARADNDAACGAVLCLAGQMSGQGGGGSCTKFISKYFSIVGLKHGFFHPARTAAKRLSFLNGCSGAAPDLISAINGRFGRLMGLF